YLVGLPPEVEKDDPNLSTVARVDRGRAVGQRDRVLERQAAARPDLSLVARRQFDAEPGRHQSRNSRLESDGFHGAQVETGVIRRAMRISRQAHVLAKSVYFHLHRIRYHSVFMPESKPKRVISVAPMPPEKSAYALARYSRSPDSIRDSLHWVRTHDSQKFLESFYFQYGHASIT